jgi:hypothetical protein
MSRPPTIHCIGDSHSSFFSGLDRIQPSWPAISCDQLQWFKTHHIGPALAYNLTKSDRTSRGRESLFEVIASQASLGDYILLSFGEIDCRVHLVKQAHKKNIPLKTAVDACLDEYFKVVREIMALGYTVIVYNITPPRFSKKNRGVDHEKSETELVAVGTWDQRQKAATLFNAGAKRRCATSGAKFLETTHHLVDKRGRLMPFFLMDNVHLAQRAMPATLVELARVCPELQIPPQNIARPPQWQLIRDYLSRRSERCIKEFKKIPRLIGLRSS